jgi:hypothetical protein
VVYWIAELRDCYDRYQRLQSFKEDFFCLIFETDRDCNMPGVGNMEDAVTVFFLTAKILFKKCALKRRCATVEHGLATFLVVIV